MTIGDRVQVDHRGLEYHGRKGAVVAPFYVDGAELLEVRLDDGRVFGLPENWLRKIHE